MKFSSVVARALVAAVASLSLVGGAVAVGMAQESTGLAQSAMVKSCAAEKQDVAKAKKKVKKAKKAAKKAHGTKAKEKAAKKVAKAKKKLRKQKSQRRKACQATATATVTATATATKTATATPTKTATSTPTKTATSTATSTATDTATPDPAEQLKAGFQQAIDQVNASPLPAPLKDPLVSGLQQLADNIPSGGTPEQLQPFADALAQVQEAFSGGGAPDPTAVLALIQALQQAGGGGLPIPLPISAGLSPAYDTLIAQAGSIPVFGGPVALALTAIQSNLPASGDADQLTAAQDQLAALQAVLPAGGPSADQLTSLLSLLGLNGLLGGQGVLGGLGALGGLPLG